MPIPVLTIPVDLLESFAKRVFLALGVDDEAAQITADALVYSELRFHPSSGQGVRRLLVFRQRIESGAIDVRAQLTVVKESPALALVDGGNGMGSVIGTRAMRLAIEKAKISGIGTVIVRNGTHFGSSAVHAAVAERAGCLGIVFTNAGPELAAWGGATAVVGTNPWGIAAPGGNGFPVILDIALMNGDKGMMRWHERMGEPIPRDWGLTPEGEETTDPVAAMAGALLGIGRYKGYGLSFMTDVLTGVISGGAFGTQPYSDPNHQDVSHYFTAIDIEWFMPIEAFRERMQTFTTMIKGSRLRPGFEEVLIPGELEHRRETERRRNGVPLDTAIFDELTTLARELGIEPLTV